MDSINFAYWLQSQFELSDVKSFDVKKTEIIKRHALLVLKTIEINQIKDQKNQYSARPGFPPRPASHQIKC